MDAGVFAPGKFIARHARCEGASRPVRDSAENGRHQTGRGEGMRRNRPVRAERLAALTSCHGRDSLTDKRATSTDHIRRPGGGRHRQCPPCQTQREPFQRQLPRTQRAGVRQPRGSGGCLSLFSGGIGGRGCVKAVRNGSTEIARHAISTALRLRISPPRQPALVWRSKLRGFGRARPDAFACARRNALGHLKPAT